MPKRNTETLEVRCPCCEAKLKVDSESGIVLTHEEKVKPRALEDMNAALEQFRGEAGRREEAFRKSVLDHQGQKQTMEKKFDELLKQAKQDPVTPPKRAFDLD